MFLAGSARGPAGDTEHVMLAINIPPLFVGHRLSEKVRGAGARESDTTSGLVKLSLLCTMAFPFINCNCGDGGEKNRSANGALEVLGERVCEAVCIGLTVSVEDSDAVVLL